MVMREGNFPSARDGRNRGVPQDHLAPAQVSARVIQGLDATLKSSNAAAQEVRNAAQQIALATERSARMTSSIEQVIQQQAEILRQINAPLSASSANSVLQRVSAVAPSMALPSTAIPSTADPSDVPLTPDRPGGDPPLSDGLPEPVSEAGLSNWDRYQRGKNYSVRQLRQDVTRWAGSKVATIGPDLRPAANRRGWEVFDPESGRSMGPATHRQIRNMNIANRVRAVGTDMAAGQGARGLANALPKGVIGPAAAVVGGLMVADQTAQFLENQRDANAAYQRILGGDNLEGMRERGSQALFSLSQRGVMSDRQSAELYQGVTRLGLTGQDRMDSLDFATQQWRDFGMEVADSISLLRINAQNGVQSLTHLSSALETVTKSARDAGVNAESARRNFAQSYEIVSPNVMGAGAASIMAGSMTAAFTDLGQAFQDTDYSGMFSAQTLRRVGAEAGLTPAQMLAETSGMQGGGRAVQMTQAAIMRVADRILGGQGKRIIQQFKRTRGLSGTLTDAQARELATEIFRQNLIQPQQAAAAVRPYGLNLNPNDALVFLLHALDGGWNPEGKVEDEIEANQMQTLTKAQRGDFSTDDGVDGISTAGEFLESIGVSDVDGSWVHGPEGGVLNMGSSGLFGIQTIHSARGLYAHQVLSGEGDARSPLISEYLKSASGLDDRFRINVGKDGEEKWEEMNIYEAIRHHADQLARGDVRITTQGGQTLADYLGRPENEEVEVDYTGAGEGAGTPWKPDVNGQGGTVGRVEIVPSKELRALIDFRTYGVAYSGGVPSSVDSNFSLPTGNG